MNRCLSPGRSATPGSLLRPAASCPERDSLFLQQGLLARRGVWNGLALQAEKILNVSSRLIKQMAGQRIKKGANAHSRSSVDCHDPHRNSPLADLKDNYRSRQAHFRTLPSRFSSTRWSTIGDSSSVRFLIAISCWTARGTPKKSAKSSRVCPDLLFLIAIRSPRPSEKPDYQLGRRRKCREIRATIRTLLILWLLELSLRLIRFPALPLERRLEALSGQGVDFLLRQLPSFLVFQELRF